MEREYFVFHVLNLCPPDDIMINVLHDCQRLFMQMRLTLYRINAVESTLIMAPGNEPALFPQFSRFMVVRQSHGRTAALDGSGQKKSSPRAGGSLWILNESRILQLANLLRSRTFGAGNNFEAHAITFGQ
jgi:hypothetical protein